MRIVLTTLYLPNYEPLAKITLPNWRAYCDKWGYELFAHCGEYGPGAIGFQKERITRDVLFNEAHQLDAAFMIDLDVMIMNHTIRVEDLIDDQHSLFVSCDCNGLNMGNAIYRKTPAARQILDYIDSFAGRVSNDQDVLKYSLDSLPFREHIKLLRQNQINSYFYDLYPPFKHITDGQYKPGDFLIHYPGSDLDQRLELFTSDRVLSNIIY